MSRWPARVTWRTGAVGVIGLLGLSALQAGTGPAPFADPLKVPAMQSRLAAMSPLMAVARAGGRLVAVGPRGHIVVSDDAGNQWVQAQVPVSSDLVGVHFPSASQGWAVGHDGVILHSSDGGATWSLQLDGGRAAAAAVSFYEQRLAEARPDDKSRKALTQALGDAKQMVQEGTDRPFLDVWFGDERVGYAVGPFNLIFGTRDGGVTWTPWFDRTDNPDALHLRAIRGAADRVFIVGERGLVLRLDVAAQRFVAVTKPYAGSFFGLLVDQRRLIAFGMRGHAFESRDDGLHWSPMDTGTTASITGGALLPANGPVVLVTQGGDILESARPEGPGASFAIVESARQPLYDITQAAKGRLVVVGQRGVRVLPVRPSPPAN